ncbi:MAG: dTMP kinase [Pseudomonadota bacterium]
MRGLFITFEGPEGAGKSTQITLLAEKLRAEGHQVCLTREPGGTAGGEAVRAALLNPEANWSSLAEALLMNAARDAHLREVILPALDRGEIVLCDRFADSTLAYQVGGGGLDPDIATSLENIVCTHMPDLTLVFDLSPEIGLERASARGVADRFEAKGNAYHEYVAKAFRTIAEKTERCVLIDATGNIEDVAKRVQTNFYQFMENKQS